MNRTGGTIIAVARFVITPFSRRKSNYQISKADVPRRNGFVLLTAIWLLVLAGAVVALLMLRARVESDEVTRELAEARARLAADSAIDTVLAERLIDGSRGRWGMVPANGEVLTPSGAVAVRLTSESGRIDLNGGDPRGVDALMRSLGADSAARARISAVMSRPDDKSRRLFASIDEAVAVIAAAAPAVADECLSEFITVASGRALPEPGQMHPRVARALGQPGIVVADPQTDAALRVEVRTAQGAISRAIVRTTPTGADGTLRLDFTRNALCGG